MSMSKTEPWKMSVYDYIGDTIIPDPHGGLVQQVYKAAEDHFARVLKDAHDGVLTFGEVNVPLSAGYSLRDMRREPHKHAEGRSSLMVFVHDASGEIVGAPRVGMSSPYVVPVHRRRGIVTEFNWHCDMEGKAFRTLGYTPEGLESRAATHRIHVERALERGDAVPADVLADYVVDENGKVGRRERYTPDVYNAEKERRRSLNDSAEPFF